MPTQQPTQLAILTSSLVWPGRQVFSCREGANNASPWTKIAIWPCELELGIANCLACCVGIILSGLQYRFWSCRDGGEDIDHDNGNLWLNRSVGVNINLACDVEMYLQVVVYHKYKTDKHIYIDMFNITEQKLMILYVLYSLGIANPHDLSIRWSVIRWSVIC